MKSLSLIFLISTVLFSGVNAAETESGEYVKRRNYVGGSDESDLKVQASLPIYKKNSNEANIEETEEGF